MAEGDEAEVVATLMELASEVPNVVDLVASVRGLSEKQRDTSSLLLEQRFNEKGHGSPLLLSLLSKGLDEEDQWTERV